VFIWQEMGCSIEKRPGSCYCPAVGQFRSTLDSHFGRHGTAVMGVLNVTPDSFYDGGQFLGAAALRRFDELVAEGAAIIDIGGESTRPGAAPVSSAEQIERIGPVLQYAASKPMTLLTVDTADPQVAEFALRAGAHAINDVSCLAEAELARVVASFSAGLILMHARGPMRLMPGFSNVPENDYSDVVAEVMGEWAAARAVAESSGVARDQILFDPGIGFWKSARHSLTLLRHIGEFSSLGAPIVVGASRKSFLSLVDAAPPELRLGGSIAACLHAAEQGVYAVRVHDVLATRQALALRRALKDSVRPAGLRERRLDGAC
jgi:dihydropteroate synthase